MEAALENAADRNSLKTLEKSSLVDSYHTLVTLDEKTAMDQWDADDLMRASLVFKMYSLDLTPLEIIFQCSTASRKSNIVLADRRYVYRPECILAYDSTYEAGFNIKYSEAPSVYIARDLQESGYIPN